MTPTPFIGFTPPILVPPVIVPPTPRCPDGELPDEDGKCPDGEPPIDVPEPGIMILLLTGLLTTWLVTRPGKTTV